MRIIGGKHKSKTLFSPKSKNTRPTSSQFRESVFNILQHTIEGSNFLDLFSGTGAMGLEALSRGASHVTFVEKNRSATDLIKKNVAFLQEEKNATILCADAFSIIKKFYKDKKSFDIIYADPPYGNVNSSYTNEILELLDECLILADGGLLLLEDAKEASNALESKHLVLEDQRKIGHGILRKYNKVS